MFSGPCGVVPYDCILQFCSNGKREDAVQKFLLCCAKVCFGLTSRQQNELFFNNLKEFMKRRRLFL
ncbi:protein of unknown function [Ruminococcaceae bacterium BL-4]|nr:protein of unknown function [Ruminococcaceae bacterium BL-4]CAB1245945.1 protein of unknown function [Ruminococcaceae bacterium BL-4]